jgi:hypothetical protein
MKTQSKQTMTFLRDIGESKIYKRIPTSFMNVSRSFSSDCELTFEIEESDISQQTNAYEKVEERSAVALKAPITRQLIESTNPAAHLILRTLKSPLITFV